MFKFLKEKLKQAVNRFSRDVEQEVEPAPTEIKGDTKEEPGIAKTEGLEKVGKQKPDINKKPVSKIKPEPGREAAEEPGLKEEEKIQEPPKADNKTIEPEPEAEKPVAQIPIEKSVAEKEPEVVEKEIPEKEEKKGFFGFFRKKKEIKEEKEDIKKDYIKVSEKGETRKEQKKELIKTEVKFESGSIKPEVPEKRSIFSKMTDIVTKTSLSESRFNDLFWELELVMLENNVAMEVIERIRSDLKAKLVDQKFDRGRTSDIIMHSLQETIGRVLDFERLDIIDMVKEKEEKPFIIAFFGVNGAGKTTNLVKIAKLLESNGLSCVIAACDTFRAAAIQQLEEHAVNVGVKVIKHDYGADAAAVAFDTIKHAKAKGKDVVLIDTAGRQHSNTNLMDELKKLVRVSRPDLRVFVGESITGNDCIEQAQFFNDAAGIDAIILTKADVDEKGGAAISISYVINKPIIFFGTGQGYEDLKEFDKDFVMKNLGLA